MPEPRTTAAAPGHRIGSTIAAIFGLVYIEVNAGSLPATVALIARVFGAAGFLLVLLGLWREGPDPPIETDAGGEGFGPGYWRIVVLEAVGIVAGSAVIRAVGLGSATVAWVSVVVGIHFFGLAAVWRMRFFQRLGTAIALCGAVAIILAAAGAGHGWVAGIGAVLPGALLLFAATHHPTPNPHEGRNRSSHL